MKILVNAIKCLSCGTIALSVHRHDFRYCKCQKVAADGGTDYLKRTGVSFADFQEESLILVEASDKLLLKQKVVQHQDERREQIPQPVEVNRIYKFGDILGKKG